MFEDYQVGDVLTFTHRIESVCLSDRGVLLIQEKRRLLISHIKGCDEPIELYQYFKEELSFNYTLCHGMVEFANFSSDKESVCFGIIMDYDLWCVIVRINQSQTGKQELQIEQLKMLKMGIESQSAALKFIDKQRRDLIVLTQWVSEEDVNLIQIIPQRQHIDKFLINRCKKLQFGWQNQPPFQQLPHFRSKSLIFSIYLNYVLVYNQLSSQNEHSHTVFIYTLQSSPQEQQNKTFPKHILALATYEELRMLSHVEVVPTDDAINIQNSIVLAFYQLPSGLEIVESDFQYSSTVKRKYLYDQLQFSQFIYSSLTLKQIEIKGIEYCLENHTILIRSQEGLSQSYLVLLRLPSTGSPRIANKVLMKEYFNASLVRQTGFWIVQPLALKYLHRIKKMEVYQMFLRCLETKGKTSIQCLSKELESFLE